MGFVHFCHKNHNFNANLKLETVNKTLTRIFMPCSSHFAVAVIRVNGNLLRVQCATHQL